jgi:hypothetical protein
MRSSSVLTFPFPVQLGPTYEPNSFGGPVEDPKYMDPPVPYQLSGEGKRYNHRADSDDFSQVSGARGKAVASSDVIIKLQKEERRTIRVKVWQDSR